jgi:endothelin-converting enzyme/putative endopeptidase
MSIDVERSCRYPADGSVPPSSEETVVSTTRHASNLNLVLSVPKASAALLLPATAVLVLVAAAILLMPTAPLRAQDAAPQGKTPVAAGAGFNVANLDATVDPCTDFYAYACGTWLKNNPIPSDRGTWSRFAELEERNLATLRGLAEAVMEPRPGRTPVERQVGDFYAACMDEKTVEARGINPLKKDLDRIAAIKSKDDLAAVVAVLHQSMLMVSDGGSPLLFGFGSEQDFKQATAVIAGVDQGGLGLPDRDYYLKDDAESAGTRAKYVEHVRKTFLLLGETPERAETAAKRVMDLETDLAKVSMDLVKRRDPEAIYHKMTRAEFEALTPSFKWDAYLKGIGAPAFAGINVAAPDFFKGLEGALKNRPLDDWKDYLRWHTVSDWSPLLSAKFVDQNFDFYGRTIGGARELSTRWKRCLNLTDENIGEALGQLYVQAAFGGPAKQRTLEMVGALEKSLATDIGTLPWMTEATKQRALGKLQAITNKIGYPDKWRDYAGVKIGRDDVVGNTARARAFELKRQLGKIGRPVDKGEWLMTPPTVNAYYNPLQNNINFPAGILQPPYFDPAMDDAVNFGGIGMVIGHELTHGFDDQGRQFDADGNLKDWWSEADGAEFDKRAACFVDEYAQFVAVGDVKLNGKLTLGENVADNGGLRIAYMALQAKLAAQPAGPKDGYTPEQRFFLNNAQVWCANVSDEQARLRALTNPHSLYKYRVNGVVVNMPEFREAFKCPAGASMAPENACRVW